MTDSPREDAYYMETQDLIYHITTSKDWKAALAAGSYRAGSLEQEGFIHASTRSQVLKTAARFYSGQMGLLLLFIATKRVSADIVYENSEGGSELFPHIYGPLNLDAVNGVAVFESLPDGTFVFPHQDGAD